MFEEGLVEPILQNEIRTPCHLYSGEGGIAVGLCAALSRDDYIFGNHRSHGHFLAKGGSMKEILADFLTLTPDKRCAVIAFAAASAEEDLPLAEIPKVA
jgi:TPP-dependent pyruvate/acetoin dehydrogenase alpha subunit